MKTPEIISPIEIEQDLTNHLLLLIYVMYAGFIHGCDHAHVPLASGAAAVEKIADTWQLHAMVADGELDALCTIARSQLHK